MTLHERMKRTALALPIVALVLFGLAGVDAALAPPADACCRPKVTTTGYKWI